MKQRALIENPDGSIAGVNRKALYEQPYFLLTNPPKNIATVPALQSSGLIRLPVSGEGPAQIISLAAKRTGPCRVLMTMQDGDSVQSLMNQAVHIDTIFGSFGAGNLRPYLMPQALYIDEARSLNISFTDISNATNEIAVAMLSDRFTNWEQDPGLKRIKARMEGRQYLSRPYWYTLNQGPITVGAGATAYAEIDIGNDHHFELYHMMCVATSMDFDINIIDVNRGESIINAPLGENYSIDASLCLGNASFPFRFHEPIMFETKTRLQVTFTNRSLSANTIELTLGGAILALRMWR